MVWILLRPGDYMMKLDLQDAYFIVPIHEQYKKYLRLQSFISPESFHKIACGSSAACVRDPNCDLLGRHPDHASGSTGDCQDFQYGSSTIGELGIPYQTGEVLPPHNSSTSILRSPPRFQEDDHCSTDGEGSKPSD